VQRYDIFVNRQRVFQLFLKEFYRQACNTVEVHEDSTSGGREKNELKCEAYYHKIFYTIIAMLHNGARGQVRQALGMPDIVIETRKYIYIIEIKINSTPEVALEQLNKKQYAVPYFTEDKEIIKLGVNFSTETRTINEWKREE
jgi:hypothetical protein